MCNNAGKTPDAALLAELRERAKWVRRETYERGWKSVCEKCGAKAR